MRSAPLDYADAAAGCASAAISACAAMTALSFECWSQTIETWSPVETPRRSWYRKPAAAPVANSPDIAFANWMSAVSPSPWAARDWRAANPWTAFYMNASPASLGSAWLSLFPLRGPPAAWPLTFMMMANGMPRSVAIPAAEANVAVMEAADAVTKPMRRAMSSYRGDGGHAMAVFMAPASFMFGALALELAEPAWPWLAATPSPFVF